MQVPEQGILSVIVPGAVDAWQTALVRFGTLSNEYMN
jgi:gamma-glutamyltranspeptidase